MFRLIKELRFWRRELLATGVFLPGDVDELEDHLLCAMDQLKQDGHSGERAFELARDRVGTELDLADEFGKSLQSNAVLAVVARVLAVPYAVNIALWLRNLLIMLLPVSVTLVSLAVFAPDIQHASSEVWDLRAWPPVTLAEPRALARAVTWALLVLHRHWLWLLPLIGLVLFGPALLCRVLARVSGEDELSGMQEIDDESTRFFLLTGMFCYPVVGGAAVIVLLQPLFLMLNVLGV